MVKKHKITEDQLCPALLNIIPTAEMGSPRPLGTQGCTRAGVTLLAQFLGCSRHLLHIQELEGAGNIRWLLRQGPSLHQQHLPGTQSPSQG